MSYDLQANATFVAFDKAIEAVAELHQALQTFRATRKYKFLPTMGAMTSDVGAMAKDLPLLRERFSDNLEDQGLTPMFEVVAELSAEQVEALPDRERISDYYSAVFDQDGEAIDDDEDPTDDDWDPDDEGFDDLLDISDIAKPGEL